MVLLFPIDLGDILFHSKKCVYFVETLCCFLVETNNQICRKIRSPASENVDVILPIKTHRVLLPTYYFMIY